MDYIDINTIQSSLVCAIFVKDTNFRSFISKNDVDWIISTLQTFLAKLYI